MSRRHHGRSRHGNRHRPDGSGAAAPHDPSASSRHQAATSPSASPPVTPGPGPDRGPAATNGSPSPAADRHEGGSVDGVDAAVHPPAPVADAAPATPGTTTGSNGAAAAAAPAPRPASQNGPTPQNGHAPTNGNGNDRPAGCTAPQLRRFIKSRPYVPMHELRRRFAIDGADDDVTQVRLEGGAVYVGLPAREGGLLGELLRGGEIGYELSLDPRTPIVVGVYPMRPIPRT